MTVNHGIVALFGVLAFFVTVSVGKIVQVEHCPDKSAPLPNFVDIEPCPSQPCIFPKGVTVNATFSFTPTEELTNGKLEVIGVIGGRHIPFPLPKQNLCDDFDLRCPLKPNVADKLSLSFPVKPAYPSLQLLAIFDLKDQTDKYVFCFQIPVKIGE